MKPDEAIFVTIVLTAALLSVLAGAEMVARWAAALSLYITGGA